MTNPYLQVGLHLNFALLRAKQGRLDDIHTHLQAAFEQTEKHQVADPDYARPLEQLGELLTSLSDPEHFKLGEALEQRA